MKSNDQRNLLLSVPAPEDIWFELHREGDACDVIVRMDDGNVYTASFVTIDYLYRQMALNYEITKQLPDTPAVRYAAIDTGHVIVESLDKDTIEDTLDNLLALDVFESYFVRVTDDDEPETMRTPNGGRRATQEVAAVVISDVLLVQQ